MIAIAAMMVLVVVWTCLKPDPWKHTISWDAFGYYLYLPANFLHHDMAMNDMSWFDEVFRTYAPSGTVYQINYMGDGGHAIKYPMGLAVLWSPFFGLGHLMARLLGQPQDGFSMPYQSAMVFATWCYLLLGLHWMRKVLLAFFSDGIVAVTICLLVAGTNLLDQAVFHMLMPHLFLFTMFAGIIRYTIRWNGTRQWQDAAMVALLIGLSILIRPTALVCVLIPLLWGRIDSHPRIGGLLRSRKSHLLLAGNIIGLICLPQLLYWKEVTGSYFYMSYTNAGEGFEFLHPWVREVLFSFRKGWFVYTPIMVGSIIGVVFLWKHAPRALVAVCAYFIVNLYVVSSWSCWWYADSFGQRALVESYAVMALPLGAFVSWFIERGRSVRIAAISGGIALVVLNLFQAWQCSEGILHSSRMTKHAYALVFGKTEKPEGLEDALLVQRAYDGSMDPPDLSRYTPIAEQRVSYDAPEAGVTREQLSDTLMHTGTHSLRIGREMGWSPAIGGSYGEVTQRDHLWARFTTYVYVPRGYPHVDCAIVVGMEHDGRKYGDRVHDITAEELVPGQWNQMTMWFLTPPIRSSEDKLHAFFWLRDTLPVWIDDARLELFEPKK